VSILNPLAREISAKIVYYGPGLSGKTTSLHAIYGAVRPERRGELVSLATETDRTIFFDFLPLHVERVRGLGVRFQLYTVPGQVFYAATRKLVLAGADGVVFVADSQPAAADANLESFEGLRANIAELGFDLEEFPLVFQYNKRDLPNALPMSEMSAMLNFLGAPEFPSCATTGDGVISALREITKLAIKSLSEQQPAVRRQIVDGDDRARSAQEGGGGGIAHSVYEASRTIGGSEPARPHPTTAATNAKPSLRVQSSAPPPEAKERRVSAQPPSGRLSFARLWPEERAAAVDEIEQSIAGGDYAAAVRASAAMLAELIEGLPGPRGGADPGTKAALLGLDGREYLRVCRLATIPTESLTEPDALLSLHVLIAARLKASSI
jgi:signal recognition particle receptor subunit beta